MRQSEPLGDWLPTEALLLEQLSDLQGRSVSGGLSTDAHFLEAPRIVIEDFAVVSGTIAPGLVTELYSSRVNSVFTGNAGPDRPVLVL